MVLAIKKLKTLDYIWVINYNHLVSHFSALCLEGVGHLSGGFTSKLIIQFSFFQY